MRKVNEAEEAAVAKAAERYRIEAARLAKERQKKRVEQYRANVKKRAEEAKARRERNQAENTNKRQLSPLVRPPTTSGVRKIRGESLITSLQSWGHFLKSHTDY